ncbi:HupE/UreJ family protein [Pelagerythrobacter rhizovicinus]|uniref:HupE/UreJ family protein n=1 Tax=Pelagerythrobacter rhizovicinus TaxID=2268576 RepID=A0A4Q2KKV3_9SPHN|nr:HupE/UreJ family protein [Pelagerythrobacter rhizovicinus]
MIAAPASADELRPGYLEFTETAPGEWRLAWKEPFTAPPLEAPPPPGLPANCRYHGAIEQGVAALAIVGTAEARCQGTVRGGAIGMPGLIGQADMLVRVAPLGDPVQALRLTSAEPQAAISARPDRMQVLESYFVIGVEHILLGWDHLLFVIALVLLLRRWRPVVFAATAFTVAHSITLAGASLGLLGMPQRPVEALIALSIVFLALEIVRLRRGEESWTLRYPWAIAFAFGLLHGFGFAGALAAIGLPEGEIAAALLAFNLGVEAGQLLVVAALMALLAALDRLAQPVLTTGSRLAAYSIGITGSYWLIDRVIG